jgi:methyl coenzyme M reductase alpha subunit
MKTTLDIPDPVFRQAKARAALRGVSLRQFVTEAIEEKVATPAARRAGLAEPPWMRGFGALADLHQESREVDARIAETFDVIDEEDRS